MSGQIVYGMSWKHPAVMLFLAIMIMGGAAMYIEAIVPAGTNGATIHRGGLYFFLAMIGMFVWGRILLHMISSPEAYLPNRSLTLDADRYERREKFIQCIGYALEITPVSFAIYKILLLVPAQ